MNFELLLTVVCKINDQQLDPLFSIRVYDILDCRGCIYDGKSSQTRFACNHTMEFSKKAALDTASSICLYYNRISKIPVTAA